jgi:hypothetical protein
MQLTGIHILLYYYGLVTYILNYTHDALVMNIPTGPHPLFNKKNISHRDELDGTAVGAASAGVRSGNSNTFVNIGSQWFAKVGYRMGVQKFIISS